ncbi:unnamed protein product [Rotaria sp. Silwood2]|nr:unnamed protein product [Rotaria sp. Silwood2]CAF4514752.1 unnamed protein product [Rotaria sp. Silwood2]CAF4613659.1 unnamed protein product [Rotaria sp. Silwood2]
MNSSTFLTRYDFRTLYGERIYAIAQHLEKLHVKQSKLEEHIDFLKKCKQNNLIPNGLHLKNTTYIYKNTQLLNKTMHKIRNNLIEHQYKQKHCLEIELATQKSILDLYLNNHQPLRQHQFDLSWINKRDDLPKIKLRQKHEIKLQKLLKNQSTRIKLDKDIDTSNVINISDKILKNEHLKILSKGLKFVPTPTNLNIIDIITNAEKSLYSASLTNKQLAISEISTFVTKWRKPTRPNLTKQELTLLKELKNDEQIIIIPADKGGKIVIMNRQDYINKVEQKLSDFDLYEEVNDPTSSLKKIINEITFKLFSQHKIDDYQKKIWTSIDDLPYVRAQPKMHKKDHPLRIITCTRSTILSYVSKYVYSLIEQLRETLKNCLKNTRNLITEIAKITLDPDDRLISIDVVDMFTNVPVSQAISIVLQLIGSSEKFCQTRLTKSDLYDLLNLCLKNSYFTFNGRFYRQKNGLPMGNILSGLIADIYLHHHLQQRLIEIQGRTWRYVDDMLVITKMSETEIEKYMKKINSTKHKIKFTYEYEKKNQLNYLDTTLTRNTTTNRIDIQWYRKDTASDRFLNYQSCHQQSIKKNIIKNMTERIITTTKDSHQQINDLKALKRMFENSQYPKDEIEKQIQETIRKLSNNDNSQSINNQKKKDEYEISMSLPYTPGIEVLKRKLDKLKIKLYFSYPQKLSSLVPSNINRKSKAIVYKIPCECGAEYIGETKRGLDERMQEHIRNIKENDDQSKSEMVQHHRQQNGICKFNPKIATVIDYETDERKRLIKETLYSNIFNTINRHVKINQSWLPILNKLGNTIKKHIRFKEQHDPTTINKGDKTVIVARTKMKG